MPALVIMAAGMGSRYDGLKQIDPVGPNDETIMDYSIYDAIRAGFDQLVFVIRRDIADVFKSQVGARYAERIPTSYVYQDMDACLGDFSPPADRSKPWGTGHAVLVCRDVVKQPFIVINADDFYGQHSFSLLANFLNNPKAEDNAYAMAGYILRNTLSEHGHVSRGVCETDSEGLLENIVERTHIVKTEEGIQYLLDDKAYPLTGEEPVSMNFWGFRPSIFAHLETLFAEFLQREGDQPKSEFYIPSVVSALIDEGKATARVLRTESSWFGVTYREDKAAAQAGIQALIDQGEYRSQLWN